jgi:hypothetical protein
MGPVKLRWDLFPSLMVPVAIVAVCPLLVWQVLQHLGVPMYAFVGIVGLLVAVYIGLFHPLWLYWGFAVTLAGLHSALCRASACRRICCLPRP